MAATVALIAIVGMIPYIALQLKAVSASVGTILAAVSAGNGAAQPLFGDIALFVALLMAAFAVLFGTRHIDATEHQDGLMLAVATEVGHQARRLSRRRHLCHLRDVPRAARVVRRRAATAADSRGAYARAAGDDVPRHDRAVAVCDRAAAAAIPCRRGRKPQRGRNSPRCVAVSAYLVLINLFVMPIAMAGLLTFPAGTDGDMFVLALPLKAHSELFALIAFVGGLSAATAMVIVESVALAIMVSNDIVMPLVLKRRAAGSGGPSNAGAQLLTVRRIAIFAILFLAYVYYRSAGAGAACFDRAACRLPPSPS